MTTRPRAPDVAGPRRKGLSEGDREIWAAYARTVAALPGRAMPEVAAETPALPPAVAQAPTNTPVAPAPRTERPAPLAVGAAPGGLDAGSWNRLRTGKLAPVRTLDLHGRTVQRAYHALHAFLVAAHADRVRCVEIITGRGSGEGGGAIRREFPFWLNSPGLRSLILAASHPHAANSGSVRLLLRRTR